MGRIEKAMHAVKRRGFLPDDVKDQAEDDNPLPIGHGQTNSQPYTVRNMLTWLDVHEGQHVLDVGSGSGWTSALLSWLTGKNGDVHAVELVPELVEMSRTNCERFGCTNVTFHQAGKVFGLPEYAPYDRILVSAGATELPKELVEQLAAPGKMVIPVNHTIWEIEKDTDGKLYKIPHEGYNFVPLVGS